MASEKKSGAGNRREFVRTKISLGERVASLVIVILLAGIGIAIAIKGRHFDPNLFAVRTESLKSTAAAVEGKAGTALSTPTTKATAETSAAEKPTAAEDGSAEGGAEHPGDAPKPALKSEPMEIALAGLKPMSQIGRAHV